MTTIKAIGSWIATVITLLLALSLIVIAVTGRIALYCLPVIACYVIGRLMGWW